MFIPRTVPFFLIHAKSISRKQLINVWFLGSNRKKVILFEFSSYDVDGVPLTGSGTSLVEVHCARKLVQTLCPSEKKKYILFSMPANWDHGFSLFWIIFGEITCKAKRHIFEIVLKLGKNMQRQLIKKTCGHYQDILSKAIAKITLAIAMI